MTRLQSTYLPALELDPGDLELLDGFQRGFPVVERPFEELARRLFAEDESSLIARIRRLCEMGVVSRLGPVLAPGVFGASTLAAMSVAAEQLEALAAVVSGFAEVNHNYERENAINLWFVVTAGNDAKVQLVLDQIRSRTGFAVLDLPMLRSYHIDLGFDLGFDLGQAPRASDAVGQPESRAAHSFVTTESDYDLVHLISQGIPLVPRPYERIAALLGSSDTAVMSRLLRLIDCGAIKRFGLVVRHHELGYRSNAMTVWNVPDDQVDAIGESLATAPDVTLCYRRARHSDRGALGVTVDWPFNLYCMVHGKDRASVIATTERLTTEHGLASFARARLFSTRRFKQRGARYDRSIAPKAVSQSTDDQRGRVDGRG